MEIEKLFKAYDLLKANGFSVQKEGNVAIVGDNRLDKDQNEGEPRPTSLSGDTEDNVHSLKHYEVVRI